MFHHFLLVGYHGELKVNLFHNTRDYTTPKRLKVTYSTSTTLESWLLRNQGEKKYTLLFHHGSFQKKVLKYGTPKPRNLFGYTTKGTL